MNDCGKKLKFKPYKMIPSFYRTEYFDWVRGLSYLKFSITELEKIIIFLIIECAYSIRNIISASKNYLNYNDVYAVYKKYSFLKEYSKSDEIKQQRKAFKRQKQDCLYNTQKLINKDL